MKRILVIGAFAAALLPAVAQAQNVIYASCFRGPWNDVIWDRPNGKFVESLTEAGFTLQDAWAIANRVCRDESLVHQLDGMKAQTLESMFGVRREKVDGRF